MLIIYQLGYITPQHSNIYFCWTTYPPSLLPSIDNIDVSLLPYPVFPTICCLPPTHLFGTAEENQIPVV